MGRENGSLLLSIVHVLDTANALGYYLIWSSQLPKEVFFPFTKEEDEAQRN